MQLPNFSVSGRAVLVTGAGRGIGRAVAKALAAGGAAVAIQDIDEAVARAAADAVTAAGGKAIALGGDLADLSLADALVDRTVEAFGDLSVLINNGSIQHAKPFVEHTLETMQQELNANLLMATLLCQRVIPRMQERKWGRIINFSSIQGLRGNDGMPAYAMSRAAMENLSTGLARRFGRDGITVNCIAPGWVNTQRTCHDFKDDDEKREKGKWLPVRRVGEPEDFAGIIMLLCSQAGEYITGQTIRVDGGMSVS